jgi:enoyl-CoA hydratase/carnithine racemase
MTADTMTAAPMTAPGRSAERDDRILLRSDAEGVASLTLNRPAQRNALSSALIGALQAALDAVAKDRAVRVVVIQAAGPAFCAGHDLRELRETPKRELYEALFQQCSTMMLSITRLPQPVIAKVQGMASAAGCQLAATCDLVVASSAARFATPGVNIGLFCSTPMVALSRAVGRKAAMEMLLTGDPVDADTAKALGLVNRVVDPGRLDAETLALARRIASKSPLTVKMGKEAFYRQAELGLAEAYDLASRVMTENMLAADAEAGIDAFLDKKPEPDWQGR